MDCSVIRDLIPLYIDECCSEESRRMVEEHVKECDSCKKILEDMKQDTINVGLSDSTSVKIARISEWQASFMQSVLLFVSFALITIGVALEAGTPSGLGNGFWAMNLVIPATGFMLSLSIWYFVRFYKRRRSFSVCSAVGTLALTLWGYGWAWRHYDVDLYDLFMGADLLNGLEVLEGFVHYIGIGLLLTALLCTLSGVLAGRFAKMLGKE